MREVPLYGSIPGYLAHKKTPTPSDYRRALGKGARLITMGGTFARLPVLGSFAGYSCLDT